MRNTKSFTRGTPEQLISALNNKIGELSGSAVQSSSNIDDMYYGADYFEALRHKVSDIIRKDHNLLVETYNEPTCLRFGVYAKDAPKEFAEYSIDKTDIVPNMEDLISDANQIVEDITSMLDQSESRDLFYSDNEDLEDE